MMSVWREVGPIVLLQVQIGPLKTGQKPHRVYSPQGMLHQVDTVEVTSQGMSARLDGEKVYDVHHIQHPHSRNRQNTNAVSFGFTSYYRQMQQRFGEHMALGIAGENMIVETDQLLTEDDLKHGVAIRAVVGNLLVIKPLLAMAPCEPFSRFCLQIDKAEPTVMKNTLQFLQAGTRGFCGEPTEDGPYSIRQGDMFLLAES